MANEQDITLLRQQRDTGTSLKPGPAVVAGPGEVRTDEDFAEVGAAAGLNGPFLADLLSACAAHENLGTNLFRAFARTTANPMLGVRFKQFEADARAAVETYHQLFAQLGVPWGYISPAARMTEAMDSKLLEAFLLAGSGTPMVLELKMVEATMMATTICIANDASLSAIAAGLDEGNEVRTALEAAVEQLSGPHQEHLDWASKSQLAMTVGPARSMAMEKGMEAVEAVASKVKDVARAIKDALT